jgi:hypothetical protein
MRKPSKFDRRLVLLTRRAIEQSLDTIALIMSAKYRVRSEAPSALPTPQIGP